MSLVCLSTFSFHPPSLPPSLSTDIDSGNSEVGSPLLQMMVLHDARHGAAQLTIDVLRFFTEEHHSVLSRIISTNDE